MNSEFEKVLCSVCGEDECSCEELKSEPIRRKVNVSLDDNCDCYDECDCYEECSCDSKKVLAIAGAGVVALGIIGGILYLAKNKK